MGNFGIICELNPPHKGHQYLMDRARSMGAERIVCVMSGNSVQRGSFAVCDKYLRAEAAIRMGADLVLELPYPWCSASAEGFARGGISVLRHFADTLIFGSECGELSRLQKAASLAADEDFRKEYRRRLREGHPAAGLYHELLRQKGMDAPGSNDILGVEYLRAAGELAPKLEALTIKRCGASYDETRVREGELPSATAIRALWDAKEWEASYPLLPEGCEALFRRVASEGKLFSEERLCGAILGWYCLHDPEDFGSVCGMEGGLASRFCAMARESGSLGEFYQKIKTKRYTDAHLRRVLLYGMTGVEEADLCDLPRYATLLAANDRGRELLSACRKNEVFSVVTKPADVPLGDRQTILADRLESLYALGLSDEVSPSDMRKKSPFIFKNG